VHNKSGSDVLRSNVAWCKLQSTLEAILPSREVEDEVKGQSSSTGFAEIHAVSMKRLSKVEAADDPSDGVRTVAGHECTRS
jgi:hypothetical protein